MTSEVPDSAAAVTFAARVLRYAEAVISGNQVACRYVKAACQRHLDDLERSQNDPDWPWVFDEQKAGRPCHFIQCLPHVEGEWAKEQLINGVMMRPRISLEDWQVFAVAVPFGWVHRVTGLRRFRRVYLEVARKNAKSTLAAGIALYLGFADGEEGAQTYSAASKKEQAKIVWGVARRMIELEPEFRYRRPEGLGLSVNASGIFCLDTGSRYQPLGRDSKTIDGLNTHAFVSDELHAQKDRQLYDVIDSSTGARAQPMGWGITTAGFDLTGVCYEQRTYLVRILNSTLLAHDGMGYRVEGDAIVDESYFGLIYTLDSGYADKDQPDDEWFDEAVWPKANPNLGVSASIEDLQAKCLKATQSTQSQPEFRTKHCNQWLASSSPWMDMVRWHRAGDPTLREEDFANEECWCALDAGFKTDFFAKVKVFRRDDHYYAFGRYWLPAAKVDAKESPRFWAWQQEGRIQVCDGELVDIEAVRESVKDDAARFNLREIPFDPAHLMQFSSEMLQLGYPMVEMRPTVMNFSEPMKLVSDLIRTGHLHHNGDPVLAWMISNTMMERKARDCIYPGKQPGQEDKLKIDGVVALIMAMGRASRNEGPVAMPDDYELCVA